MVNDNNSRRTMTSSEKNDDNDFACCLPKGIQASNDKASWENDSFLERGENPNATSPTRVDRDPNCIQNDIFLDEKESTQLLNRRDTCNDSEDFHEALPLSSPCDHEPSFGTDKKIRFADIIATDMEATSGTPPQGHFAVLFSSEERDNRESLTLLDLLEQDATLETTDGVDEDEDDVSFQMSEESVNERTRIRQQLWYAVSGAGVMALLGWTGSKILQLFQKRVDEEDDDRVAGGDMWGNSPIGDHLQIKETATGLFVNQGNKSSPSHSANGLCVAVAETGSLQHAAVQQ